MLSLFVILAYFTLSTSNWLPDTTDACVVYNETSELGTGIIRLNISVTPAIFIVFVPPCWVLFTVISSVSFVLMLTIALCTLVATPTSLLLIFATPSLCSFLLIILFYLYLNDLSK